MTEKISQDENNRNSFYLIGILFLLLIGLFLAARFLIPQTLVYLTQAVRTRDYSLSNSYVFGAPLSVEADGQSKIRVSAFLLTNEGRGFPDRQIDLRVTPREQAGGTPEVQPVQPITDNFGQAIFEVSSTDPGQYVVTAVVDGMEIPQTVTLTFR